MILGEIIFDLSVPRGIWELAHQIKKIGLLIIPVFMLIEAGSAIIRYFFNQDGNFFPNLSRFYSHILLWVCLLAYVPIMQTLDLSVNSIVKYTDSIQHQPLEKTFLEAKYMAMPGGIAKAAAEVGKPNADTKKLLWWDNLLKSIGRTTSLVANASTSLLLILSEAVADSITWIIRLLIENISILLSSVLLVIGPLAIAFNTAPFFGPGTLVKWFTTWLGIKCWALTMSVLDLVIERISAAGKYAYISGINPFDTTSQLHLSIMINYSMVIAYVMVPWITNKYINNDGGGMMGTAIQGAKQVTSAIATKGASLLK